MEKMNAALLAGLQLSSAGMIYLRDNPLLRSRCGPSTSRTAAWTLGLRSRTDLFWVHLNRLIKKYDLNMIYISGSGARRSRGARQFVSGGHLPEVYPDKSQDEAGL